jgi:YegS/Rv2252/BmrU family lipid kinase
MKRRRVAVVAHRGKDLDGGLDALRVAISEHPVEELLWYEVPKSKKAPKQARRALDEGADLLFVWGGDGMVQRCLDAVVGTGSGSGSDVEVAVVPAGTANLFASNLGIPIDLAAAVQVGFAGDRRRLDLGCMNGEHFAVMAGAGFDALMIRDADRGLKDRFGRLAYVWTGVKAVKASIAETTIDIDGTRWFSGPASCVLLGNVGTISGGIQAFDDAKPDDGWLDVGVVTATGAIQWARTLGRMATSRSDRSPFVRVTRARRIEVVLDRPLPYELDGGDRKPTDHLDAEVRPSAVTVCVPAADPAPEGDGQS